MRWLWLVSVVVPSLVWSQDVRWLDAEDIRFAEPATVSPMVEHPPSMPPSVPATPPPLYTRATVARDTPAPLLTFANERTLDNARAFYDFMEQRRQALLEMGRLYQQVIQERKR